MDLLRPGISLLALHHIRSTNTVSARLLQQLRKLHDETNFYLQTASLPADVEAGSVESTFQDFYYAIGGDNAAKLASIPEISLPKLRQFQKALRAAPCDSESRRTLAGIVDRYCVILAAHHFANLIISKNLICKNQLRYWGSIKISRYSQTIYGIQTMPVRAWRLLSFGVKTSRAQNINTASGFLDAGRKTVATVLGSLNSNFIVRSLRLRILKVPLGFIDAEARAKMDTINAQLDVQYEQLGRILNSLPVDRDVVIRVLGLPADASIDSVLAAVQAYVRDDSEYASTAPPGFVARYWPVLLLLAHYGPSTITSAWTNRREIAEWVRLNFVDTVVGFWRNWVVKPVGDMLAILRDDDALTITSKESLRSDLDSLERMVTDFMKDNNMPVDPPLVHSAVAQGDLTMMMSQYEHDIRTPYRLIVKGLLVRSMLIQIQKTKVDGLIAITGIDRLLKSQQLLFGILLVLPSLFILYQANRALHEDTLTPDMVSRRTDCLKCLNHIAELVNQEIPSDKLVLDGKLFMEIVNLVLLSRDVIPKKLKSEWMHDLNELTVASTDSFERASRIVNRVWNMYSPFFR